MDPLNITEFASPKYFDKLRALNESSEHGQAQATREEEVGHPVAAQSKTFTLPIGNPRPHPGRRRRSDDTARSGEAKKRSLGHDLTSLRTQQRRPSFAVSISSFRAKVGILSKSTTIHVEHDDYVFAEDVAHEQCTLHDLFFALPSELQLQVITALPVPTILNLRLTSRSFHSLVSSNDSALARYHLSHSVPRFASRLYPLPDPAKATMHHLCGLWHRLHVAARLSTLIAEHTTKEIFLRNSEAKYKEFEPQHSRMRRRLMPLIFVIFHFFEKSREVHVNYLSQGGIPLRLLPYTINPLERQVMDSYDDQTLLQVHQIFPLVLSSYSRRLRPPSYAGRLERSIKGYLKDKPADEVYATILEVGGLRQAESFWRTKGYNDRRAAVDTWYGFVTQGPVEVVTKSKLSKLTNFGRRKVPAVVENATIEGAAGHDVASCNEWFCVKPSCARLPERWVGTGAGTSAIFSTSLAAGPPMGPLPRDRLRMLLNDQQPFTSIWMATAEAVILERKVVDNPQHIKRNTRVLLELIREDSSAIEEADWEPGLSQARTSDLQAYLGLSFNGADD